MVIRSGLRQEKAVDGWRQKRHHSPAMKSKLLILLLVAFGMLLPCQNSMALWGKAKTPTVRLSDEGRIYVGKKYTGLTKLASELKSKGIKTNVRIIIEIPHNTSPDAIAAISRELVRHGYRRYLFNKPQKATAEKGLDPLIKHLEKKPKK
jgi:biopolymer transport protein ExbD